jgi:hypothetical protein
VQESQHYDRSKSNADNPPRQLAASTDLPTSRRQVSQNIRRPERTRRVSNKHLRSPPAKKEDRHHRVTEDRTGRLASSVVTSYSNRHDPCYTQTVQTSVNPHVTHYPGLSRCALLAYLTGWSVDSLTLVRPEVRSWSGQHQIIQRIDSAQDIAQPGWNSLFALLHLQRWELFRDVEHGFVDLYLTPSASHPWDSYTPEVYDDTIASRLTDMRDQMLGPVTAIVQEVLQERTLRLAYSGSVKWEEEGTPVTGGDSYRCRLVITGDT